MSTQNVCLCIHGHFYQPPRENPAIGEIERQPSAAPFHDWNERIHYECYMPNAMARVLDKNGKIINIVNNYESMSFNFGPTLFSWMAAKHPDTYEAILKADRKSREHHKGHGNAMAQVYNHIIMPLANARDKNTQVRWGIRDFEYRFQRKPEGMWLSEAACNEETLEALMENGIKFTVLAPQQAAKIRPLKGGDWKDVSKGSIDPRHAYRYLSKKGTKKFIEIFFYDGPVANDLGFGNLAYDAKALADRIEQARGGISSEHAALIHISTDGETFGHHKAFGDRTLAYLLSVEAKNRNLRVVNYAEFLVENPPEWEVQIHLGENGKGSSWSCVHGVKRWAENCGCRTGGPAEWNQEWRKPLREALDWLRDEMAQRYESGASVYFKDVWKAREDYIDILLEGLEKKQKDFFQRHSIKQLKKDEQIASLKWLECQRYALFMYTSCGWFFDELSGLEASQVLFYALQAIALCREVSGVNLESGFLDRMSHAKSNIKEFRNGRVICERLIKPKLYRSAHITASYAMGLLMPGNKFEKKTQSLYSFQLEPLEGKQKQEGKNIFASGRLKILNKTTGQEEEHIFRANKTGTEFKAFVNVFNFFFTLADIPVQEKVRILNALHLEIFRKMSTVYTELYQSHQSLIDIYRSVHLPLAAEMKFAVQSALGRQFYEGLEDLSRGYQFRKALRVFRILSKAKSLEVPLDFEKPVRLLSDQLTARVREFIKSPAARFLTESLYFLKLAERLRLELDLRDTQNELFAVMHEWVAEFHNVPEAVTRKEDLWKRFLSAVGFNPRVWEEIRNVSKVVA